MFEQQNPPFFYILIPAFNVEDYILTCLESIDTQSYRNFECHIINDGSEDKTLECIKGFIQSKKNFFVYNQSNKGISLTRNQLLKKVGKGYVVWIDPDDYIDVNYLETCSFLISRYQPDILLFDFFYKKKKEYRHVLPFNEGFVGFDIILKELAFDWQFPSQLWNKVYRSDLFENINFSNKLTILEDFALQVSLFKKGQKFYYASQSFYHYVQHEASALSKKNKQKEISQLKIRRERVEEILRIDRSLFNVCLLSWLISYYYSLSLTFTIVDSREDRQTYTQLLEKELEKIEKISKTYKISFLNKVLLLGCTFMRTPLIIFLPKLKKFSRVIKKTIAKFR